MGTDERKGDWQQTFTGRQFWPLDPRPEDVCIEDIAHALSMQCRFAGHCRTFYSVAEHSVRVSREVERYELAMNGRYGLSLYILMFAALLHDASEAYCVDVPRPLKPYLTGYKEIEHGVMLAIEEWAGIGTDGRSSVCEDPAIKRADEVLLMTEARDLMGKPPAPWGHAQGMPAEPLPNKLLPWSPYLAEREFLREYNMLKGRLK